MSNLLVVGQIAASLTQEDRDFINELSDLDLLDVPAGTMVVVGELVHFNTSATAMAFCDLFDIDLYDPAEHMLTREKITELDNGSIIQWDDVVPGINGVDPLELIRSMERLSRLGFNIFFRP